MNTVYQYSILLIAFLLPSAFYGATLGMLALTFLCWWYAGNYKRVLKTWNKPQLLLPVLFYLYLAGGIFFSHHFGDALSALSTRLSFFLFPFIIGTSSIVNKELIERAANWFIFSICLFLTIAIGYAVVDVLRTHEQLILVGESIYNKFLSFGLTRVFPNWHPTNVSVFANLAIVLQAQKWIRQHSASRKFIGGSVFVLLFLSVCIFLLNSVNAIATYCLLVLYFLLRYLKRLKIAPLVKVGTLLTIGIVLFSLLYFNPLKMEKIEALKKRELKITDRQEERNILTLRLAKWDTYLEMFKTHWLLGTTEGDIKYIRQDTYKQKGFEDLAHYNLNAHNQYLEVLTTLGMIGFLLFAGFLLLPLLQDESNAYYLPFLLIVSIAFLTESLLVRQQGILFFMFFYALFTHPGAVKKRAKKNRDLSPC